ncbi:MAG: hypothetical protein DRG30_07785, partial [Epsilonproteobacteria bacterium]
MGFSEREKAVYESRIKELETEITRMKEGTEDVVRSEIVIPYDTKYPDIIPIDRGVIVARTGAGKTFKFENIPDTLILVPRVLQTTVETGDSLEYLMLVIMTRGAIITYNKFYGHYRQSEEFRKAVDSRKIKIVVDEAHMLVAYAGKMNKLIYNLDAVFLSGTIEKFFRADLQRYKYKPTTPNTIYYTDGVLPNIKGSLIFVENAKALMHNYPKNCVV